MDRSIPTRLLDDLGDDTRADRPAAFPNSEVAPNVEGHRLFQPDGNSGVVAGHDHLDTLRQTNFAGDVCGLEKELRLVAAEERRVPSTVVLAQDVDLTLELRPWPDRPRSSNHLASPDLIGLDASQQQADVLSSFASVQRFVERLDIGADTFENAAQAENLDPLAHGDDALLDLTGRHRTPAFDGVNTLDRHEEGLVDGSLRLRDVRIQCIQQFADAPAVHRVGWMVQCALGIATDDGGLLPIEAELRQEF